MSLPQTVYFPISNFLYKLTQPNIHNYCTLLDKFWRIWLYVADNAIAKLYVTYVKFRHLEGNGRKCRHIEVTVCTW